MSNLQNVCPLVLIFSFYQSLARIKAEAASNQITSVETSGQRLMLQRNGSPILMNRSRYPRLANSKPGEKLDEALERHRNLQESQEVRIERNDPMLLVCGDKPH